MTATTIPITTRIDRARGRDRRDALNAILPRLAALRPYAVKLIAEDKGCKLHEMQHNGLTLWFSWFSSGLNVAVYDGPSGSIPGMVSGQRVFSITFDPNNLSTAKPMGWKRGDWEARLFQPVADQ